MSFSPRWALLVLGLFVACQPADARSRSIGDITGTVSFAGSAPARVLDRSLEPGCENGTAYVETVLSWDGKLANVHVAIEPGTMGKHPVPVKPAIVQQADCLYVPRVQGIIRGQKVLVTNGDPNMHNVHAKSDGSSLTNKSQPANGKPIEIDSQKAGPVLELGCDVHRWMRAYMPITDHPYFDVTGEDGAFRIRNVPDGMTVKVRAWHEKYGTLLKEAKAGETVEFGFAEL